MVSKPVDLDDVKCLDPDFYRQRAGLSAVSAVSAQLNQGPAKRHGSSWLVIDYIDYIYV